MSSPRAPAAAMPIDRPVSNGRLPAGVSLSEPVPYPAAVQAETRSVAW